MTTQKWKVSGQYYETCSCDFVCPCITGQMAVAPTQGTCTFAMGFQIEQQQRPQHPRIPHRDRQLQRARM